jgi:hypothetical protein
MSGIVAHRAPLISLLLSTLMVSCAQDSPIHSGAGEWVGSNVAAPENSLVATFDWSKLPGVITQIDDNSLGADYKKARLSPGRHVIAYAYYPAEFGVHPRGSIEIDLEAAHSYEFGLRLCYWCMPRKYAVWVDDKTARERVWGKRPDWPAWYL